MERRPKHLMKSNNILLVQWSVLPCNLRVRWNYPEWHKGNRKTHLMKHNSHIYLILSHLFFLNMANSVLKLYILLKLSLIHSNGNKLNFQTLPKESPTCGLQATCYYVAATCLSFSIVKPITYSSLLCLVVPAPFHRLPSMCIINKHGSLSLPQTHYLP